MNSITVPLEGTLSSVTFYPDDTIETVSRWIALQLESHPARLFIEVMTTLPSDYYSSNPMRWTELFYRLSYKDDVINTDALRTYLEYRRPRAGVAIREITKEEWESHEGDLKNLFSSEEDIQELRILGVPVENSLVLPIPPRDIGVPAARIPIPVAQRMYEAIHPYPITSIRATVLPSDASEKVKLLYYPLFVVDTPPNIESIREFLEKSQTSLKNLLALPAPKQSSTSIVRARWYIPLIDTQIQAVENRFEQMFYGLTLSKDTPYIGYSVSRSEVIRSKFYVENPKNKVPWLKEELVRSWYIRTQPQRRKPTLLLYRGKNRTEFDRILITDTDIVLQAERSPNSKKTLDELRTELSKWLESLDSILPFLDPADLQPSRWELSDMSLHATYEKDIEAFDLRKLPCLRFLFNFQEGQFRLLRADVEAFSADKLQAYQLFQQDPMVDKQTLIEVLGISAERAEELLEELRSPDQEINLDKALKVYPTFEFTERDVNIRFVTNPERTLGYVNLLRYVLTQNTKEIRDVCDIPPDDIPARQGGVHKGGNEDDEEDLLDFGDDEEEPAKSVVSEEKTRDEAGPETYMYPVSMKLKGNYNYFNRRLEQFDPETFDQSFYTKECDKPRQAVVLTSVDKERIRSTVGEDYTYENTSAQEKLELFDPDGTVICPPYWCMRDEIPLREDQLVEKDGQLACPVCKGKVITESVSGNPLEFTVIRRDTATKYPGYLKRESTINKRKIPCCYKSPLSEPKVVSLKEDDTYILRETVTPVPPLRWAYVSDELAAKLHMKLRYNETVDDKNYLMFGKEDLFRIGLGRPSKTLPILFKQDKKTIPRPRDAKENVLRCSFFRTRRSLGDGGNTIEQLLDSVDTDFQTGTLSFLEELEYTTSFLKCEVMRVDSKSGDMLCGFWRDVVGGDRFILLVVDTEVIGFVKRERVGTGKGAYRTLYQIDVRKFESASYLTTQHEQSCVSGIPTVDDAIQVVREIGAKVYEVLMDPFDRIQAILVPGVVMLPVSPTSRKLFEGVKIHKGFSDLTKDDLPTRESVYNLLNKDIHKGFRPIKDHSNTSGEIVEVELESGFRIPIKPEAAPIRKLPSEVTETVKTATEETLVSGNPNEEDIKTAQQISYESEMYEFLLFSLSRDIQLDLEGEILNASYQELRTAIESRSSQLYKILEKWFEKESYKDTIESPTSFINKIRKPCGQFKAKDACNKSTLCGWHKNDCRIRIRPTLDAKALVRRLAKALYTNDKQRSLVLDARLSPFFSTVLYLEMPNELFTTSV